LNPPRSFLRKLSLLAAIVAVLAVALVGPHQPVAMAVCPDAAGVYYYSDATYTTKVGQCTHACCRGWTCTGTLTNYSVVVWEFTCDFN
jgi:hypothetical protein